MCATQPDMCTQSWPRKEKALLGLHTRVRQTNQDLCRTWLVRRPRVKPRCSAILYSRWAAGRGRVARAQAGLSVARMLTSDMR